MALFPLLTPPSWYFVDAGGNPLVGGTVAFLVPNTTELASVYADPAGALPLQNPCPIDAAGRLVTGGNEAQVYGLGTFEIQVKDSSGRLAPGGGTVNSGDEIFNTLTVVNSGTIADLTATSITTTGFTASAGTVTSPGTAGNELVNFSQFAPSAAGSGYIHLPGGVTVQWGVGVGPTAAVTFPYVFSAAPWCIQMTIKDAPGGGATIIAQTTTAYTTTGFTGLTVNSAAGGGSAADFFWVAIGPT